MMGLLLLAVAMLVVVVAVALFLAASRRERVRAGQQSSESDLEPGTRVVPGPLLEPVVFSDSLEGAGDARSEDEIYAEAVRVVVDVGTVAILPIQRRVRVDFDRATALVERMEAEGLVGQADGNRPRKVLPAAHEFVARDDAGT